MAMDDQEDIEKHRQAIKHLEAVAKLGCSSGPLWFMRLSSLVGDIQFQLWLKEKQNAENQ